MDKAGRMRREVAAAMLAILWVFWCSTVVAAESLPGSEASEQDPDAFLERNRQKTGVIVTTSGLQYEILKKGNGILPTSLDVVHIFHSGYVLGSTMIIDTNFKAGVPDHPQVGTVIKGLEEGLQLMTEGSIYRFYIPPSLAYGQKGRDAIGPNKLLIYTVELVKVERAGRQ